MFLQFEGAEATMEDEEGERFISKQPLWVVSPVEGDLGRRAKSKAAPWHLGASNLILGSQRGRTKLFRGGRTRSLVDSFPTLPCLQATASHKL